MSNVSLIDGHIDEMTDTEIIKALECCCKNNNCEGCPLDYFTFSSSQCASELSIKSLDLINRQKAEIEILNNNLSAMVVTLRNSAKATRNEAIKEFWGKLKKHSRKMQSSDFSGEFWDRAVLVEDGDNLEKEMVGEE